MRKFTTIFTIISTIFLTSCNGWLNITPEDSISDDDLFSTGFGFRNALNGVYLQLSTDALYGKELSWGFMSAISQQYDQKNATDRPIYRDASELMYNTLETKSIVENIWEESYLAIANVNKLIKAIESADSEIFEYGNDEKLLIYAESVALRAMLHLELISLFAPAPSTNPVGKYIPYRSEYEAYVGEKLEVGVFMEKLLSDLIEAERILKIFDTQVHPNAMYANMMYEHTPYYNARYRFYSQLAIDDMGDFFWFRGFRLNYMAVLGLKARAALYAGEKYYSIAQSAANELYNDFYKTNRWVGFTTQEHISQSVDLRYTKACDDVLFGVYDEYLARDYESSVVYDYNSIKLPLANVDELFISDNIGAYSDNRLDYQIAKTNETYSSYYSLKYDESSDETIKQMENTMIPVIRLSEICHILAELSAYSGNIDQGIEYLEVVRRARGANRSLKMTVQTSEQLLEEIILDMRKENIGEGRTFYA